MLSPAPRSPEQAMPISTQDQRCDAARIFYYRLDIRSRSPAPTALRSNEFAAWTNNGSVDSSGDNDDHDLERHSGVLRSVLVDDRHHRLRPLTRMSHRGLESVWDQSCWSSHRQELRFPPQAVRSLRWKTFFRPPDHPIWSPPGSITISIPRVRLPRNAHNGCGIRVEMRLGFENKMFFLVFMVRTWAQGQGSIVAAVCINSQPSNK